MLKLKSTGTLCNWRMQGKGPTYIKFGRRVLYPIKELEEYMRENFKECAAAEPGERLIEREEVAAD